MAPPWVLLIVAINSVEPGLAATLNPFTEEASARGLVYPMLASPGAYGFSGWGCGFIDLDEDGDSDVVILGAPDRHVGIFENVGGFFIDRSAGSGVPLLQQASALAAADYDGDGDLDLYFTQWGLPNVLMRNDRNFQFTNVTVAAGVGDFGASKAACWGDYDGDGWLDIYVCNYSGQIQPQFDTLNPLYRNMGNGTFQEVGAAMGVNDFGYGFQAVWTDYDRDGDVDLYLSNDRGYLPPLFRGNQLWRNDGGQFVNVSETSGAGVALFSMGVACGDFDRNGYPDLYCTNIPSGGGMDNPLLLGQPNGTFVEVSQIAGVENPDNGTSWGAIFLDFDNEGHLDLYVNNMFQPNTLYMGAATFPCIEVAGPMQVQGNTGVSYCSAMADIDDDGDLDLLVNNQGANVQLFINHSGDQRQWVRFRVVGEGSNTHAIGASVETRVGAVTHLQELLAGGNGFLGQNELIIHVGLGDVTIADEVVVTWPTGSHTRTLTGFPSAETWSIYPASRLGDAQGDGVINYSDFEVLASCYGAGFSPGCEMMDFDGDSDIDRTDIENFMLRYSDTIDDCDDDGDRDLVEILFNPGADMNENGVLDACECPADFTGPGGAPDGNVDSLDFLTLIGGWGSPCTSSCTADITGPTPLVPDGNVDALDLLIMIGQWGSPGNCG